MRKGEIACYKQFLLFSQCFPQLYILMRQNVALCGNDLTKWHLLTPLGNKPLENTVGKGEIAHDEQFLLYPVFSVRLENFLLFSWNLKLSSADCFNLDLSKILSFGNGLILTCWVTLCMATLALSNTSGISKGSRNFWKRENNYDVLRSICVYPINHLPHNHMIAMAVKILKLWNIWY